MVGGDAVATRRFLGNNPPLATLAQRGGRPVIFLRDLIGTAESSSWQAVPWRDFRARDNPERVGNAVLESDP